MGLEIGCNRIDRNRGSQTRYSVMANIQGSPVITVRLFSRCHRKILSNLLDARFVRTFVMISDAVSSFSVIIIQFKQAGFKLIFEEDSQTIKYHSIFCVLAH